MERIFAAYQIAELAAQIEEEGAKFYTRLAEMVRDGKAKSLFSFLAAEEMNHKAAFYAMADESKPDKSSFDYSIDLYGMMKYNIEEIKRSVFDLRSVPVEKIDLNIKRALRIAVRLEEESIRVYSEIRNNFVERFSGILTKIISEEKKHLEMLSGAETRMSFEV